MNEYFELGKDYLITEIINMYQHLEGDFTEQEFDREYNTLNTLSLDDLIIELGKMYQLIYHK